MLRTATASLLVLALSIFVAGCGGGGGGGGGGGDASPTTRAELASLSVSSGDLVPAFDPDTTAYTIGPLVTAGTATVVATAAETDATVKVDGLVLDPGKVSPPMGLFMGPTDLRVEVIAGDGVTRRIYTITVDRTSAELSAVTASAGQVLPSFDEHTFRVGPSLEPGISTLTPKAADPAAMVKVNGVETTWGQASEEIRLAGGLTPVTVEVTARDGVTKTTYTVVFDRSLSGHRAYLKGANADAGDRIGYAVAISGDTLVVGAYGEDGNGSNPNDDSMTGAGAAYVFVRTGTTWSQQAYLKAQNVEAGDSFGYAVGISGDTIVVGAPEEDGDGSSANDNTSLSAGAAYVFTRTGTNWSQQAYLKAGNADAGDRFGGGVFVWGDTVVVGATEEDGDGSSAADNSAQDSGAAYVFFRNGTTWSQQGYLKADNVGATDRFGYSVGIHSDTVVVGAYGEDGDGTSGSDNSRLGSGAAYVYLRTGTTWAQEAYLKAGNLGVSDHFGLSVAVFGDTVVVGAYLEDGDGTDPSNDNLEDSGAAYVFERNGTTWTQEAYLKASNLDAEDNFGVSVAISTDTMVIGAYAEDSANILEDDNTAWDSGAAYVFVRGPSGWEQQSYVKSTNVEAFDRFGLGVAISGNTLAIGAYLEDGDGTDPDDNNASEAGAVYINR